MLRVASVEAGIALFSHAPAEALNGMAGAWRRRARRGSSAGFGWLTSRDGA